MSVSEVRVIETPALSMASPTRSGTSTVSSAPSKAFVMTKASSIPMPTKMNGRICVRTEKGTSSSIALPKPPTQATSTSKRSHRPQVKAG